MNRREFLSGVGLATAIFLSAGVLVYEMAKSALCPTRKGVPLFPKHDGQHVWVYHELEREAWFRGVSWFRTCQRCYQIEFLRDAGTGQRYWDEWMSPKEVLGMCLLIAPEAVITGRKTLL